MLLTFLLIYFVGKSYYDLASKHKKNKWGFAILGVVSYYAGLFIAGIVIALVYEFGMSQSIEDVPEIKIGLMALPFGVLSCWGLYRVLKSQWGKPVAFSESEDVLDANLIDQPQDDTRTTD